MNYARCLRALVAWLLAVPAITLAAELKPYSAVYETSYKLLSARGERSVEARGDGTWQIRSSARVLNFDMRESATFSLRKNRLVPLTYQVENPFSEGRNQQLTFDWSKNTVSDAVSGLQHPLAANTFDKLSYQLQLQLNACADPAYRGEDFRLVDRKRIKSYRAEVVGRETLQTALGPLNTVHLKLFRPGRESDGDEVWLATDWQCLLVQLQQNDDGDSHTLKLVSAKVAGKDVTGK